MKPEFKLKASLGKYFQLIREETFDDPLYSNQDGFRLPTANNANSNTNDQGLSIMESDHIIAGFQYMKNN